MRLNLSTRIIGTILLGLVVTAWVIVWRSEAVLENAMLDQAKRQAQVFLHGLEREMQVIGRPDDPVIVQGVLDEALGRDKDLHLGFSVRKLYAYGPDGAILGYLGGGKAPGTRDVSGHYGAVVHDDQPYLGDEVEWFTDPQSGRSIPKADVIIPLHHNGKPVAGLEVEINLEETAAMIRRLDDDYEDGILIIVAIGALGLLVLVSVVIQRGLILPIRSLGGVTGRIANGELGARVDIRRGDEMGQLGESVNAMADSIEHLFNEQEQAYLQMLQSLAKALEAKDAYTAKHSARVARFSVMLGKRLGLDEQQLKLLKQGALMHDLGKIGISDQILNKPSALTDEEYEVMRNHPVYTATIMRPLKRFKEFAEIAAWHHERWDGRGYPDGLKGTEVPLLARIVAIADSWDAMTGDRVYRKGMSPDKALDIMEKEMHAGQWDPELLAEFIDMVRGSQEARHEVERDMHAESLA